MDRGLEFCSVGLVANDGIRLDEKINVVSALAVSRSVSFVSKVFSSAPRRPFVDFQSIVAGQIL